MSVLSGPAITEQIERGRIVHDPPSPHIGPNSADLSIGHTLLVYRRSWWDRFWHKPLDPENLPPLVEVPKRRDGRWLLVPGELYLATTYEWTETYDTVPYLDGRSSLGRLGVFIHCTAGRGDRGFKGNWTLEISCVRRVLIRPGTRCLQITYHTVEGDDQMYDGRYQGDTVPTASKLEQE